MPCKITNSKHQKTNKLQTTNTKKQTSSKLQAPKNKQAPNYKHQFSNKLQIPSLPPKRRRTGKFQTRAKLFFILLFVICYLGFPLLVIGIYL
jgi:hypothetical protein